MQTLEERMAAISAATPEPPTPDDLAAIAAAEAEGYDSAVSLDEFRESLAGYSGRFILRLPRSLHKRLRSEAEAEGVSLNQYILYKLAK